MKETSKIFCACRGRQVNQRELTFDKLKKRHRGIRSGLSESLALPTHRALSWLQRAEAEIEDEDAQFLFLWIAFNAAYAHEIANRRDFSERRISLDFLKRLVRCDQEKRLQKLTWVEFPKPIRLLLNNKYVFQPFWDYQTGPIDESQWLCVFDKSKATANRALGTMNTTKVLAIVFERLYVLCNQLVHGGATWNSVANRV